MASGMDRGYLPPTAAEEPQGPVGTALSTLEYELGVLQDRISIMNGMANPYLSPDTPSEAKLASNSIATERSPQSAIGYRIDDCVSAVRNAAYRIESICNRME